VSRKKTATVFLLNNCVKDWPICIILGNITMKIDVNEYSFSHLTLILLLHYLVKSRTRSLAVYNNEFILGTARISSEKHCKSTKSLKIVNCLTLIVSTLRSRCHTYIQCAVGHCFELFPQSHIRQCLKPSSQVLCTSNFFLQKFFKNTSWTVTF